MNFDWPEFTFSLLCGGLAFRSVARTHEMLKPQNFANRPLLLHQKFVPLLIVSGFLATLISAAILGWHYSGLSGIILRPLEVSFAGLLLDFAIERTLPLRLRYFVLLNPFAHFFVLPYIFAAGTVLILIFVK